MLKRTLCLVALLAFASVSQAQIQPPLITKGQKAPFRGVLLTELEYQWIAENSDSLYANLDSCEVQRGLLIQAVGAQQEALAIRSAQVSTEQERTRQLQESLAKALADDRKHIRQRNILKYVALVTGGMAGTLLLLSK